MTDSEARIIQGELMLTHTETKKRLALIRSETTRIGKSLVELGTWMQHPLTHVHSNITPDHLSMLDQEKIEKLLADLKETASEVSRQHSQLSELGLV